MLDRFRSVRPIQQLETAECGVACLAMVLDFYGASIPLAELRDFCGTSRDGNSMLQLLEAGCALGLEGRALQLEIDDLKDAAGPLILHWELSHFVVLERIGRRRAVIVDPARGRHQIDRAELDRCFSGLALEFVPSPRLVRRRRSSAGVAHYFENLRSRLGAVAYVVLAGATAQLLGVIAPGGSQLLIDQVIRPQRTEWLLPLLSMIVGSAVLGSLLRWLYQQAMARLRVSLGVQLSEQLGRRLLRLPLTFIESRGQGELLQRVSSYAGLGSLLTQTTVGLFDAFFACALIALMLAYEPRLALLALSIDLLRLILMRVLKEDVRQRTAGEIAARARESSIVIEATTNAEMVKSFGLEQQLEQRYASRLGERLGWTQRSARLSSGVASWLSVFDGLASAVVLWVGGRAVIDGETSLGVFAGFMAMRAMLGGPLGSLLSTLDGWLKFRTVLARTDELLEQKPIPRGQVEPCGLQGRLELIGVGFRYGRGAPWLFRNVSLVIQPGQSVALAGPSGHGKTTLLRVLCGVLEPTEGRVLLDGIDIAAYAPESLARHVGTLLGEPLVIDGTVRENVTLRLPDATDAEVLRAAQISCFDQVVERMPLGFSSSLTGHGATLSGGERQRLGLAQAVLAGPRVMFLDEATCFLDLAAEARVLANLRAQGMTLISVAHRPAVISASDQIIRVERGQVRALQGEAEARSAGRAARAAAEEGFEARPLFGGGPARDATYGERRHSA